jgi:hypothetical protein
VSHLLKNEAKTNNVGDCFVGLRPPRKDTRYF